MAGEFTVGGALEIRPRRPIMPLATPEVAARMGDDVRDNENASAAAPDGPPAVRPYDFRRPYKAQVRRPSSLEPLHATFASKLAAALSEHLRSDVTVTLAHVEQLRYDEFLYSIGPVTCLSVLRVDPPGAQVILDLGLPVIHP